MYEIVYIIYRYNNRRFHFWGGEGVAFCYGSFGVFFFKKKRRSMVYTVYYTTALCTLHSVVIYDLCDLWQIFLTLRLDDDMDWSFAAVLAPLLGWVFLTLLGHVYEVKSSTTISTCRMCGTKRLKAVYTTWYWYNNII